jgi:hypothetical protein
MTQAQPLLFNWQELVSLAELLELTQAEVLSRIGKEVERLNRGGKTLYRLRKNLSTPRLDSRPSGEGVKNLFADAISEFKKRRVAGKTDFLEQRESDDDALHRATKKRKLSDPMQPWGRFPCWFEPQFCSDEESLS